MKEILSLILGLLNPSMDSKSQSDRISSILKFQILKRCHFAKRHSFSQTSTIDIIYSPRFKLIIAHHTLSLILSKFKISPPNQTIYKRYNPIKSMQWKWTRARLGLYKQAFHIPSSEWVRQSYAHWSPCTWTYRPKMFLKASMTLAS